MTEEFVDALPDAFPRLRDITELKIAYPWWHSPISFEVLRKLRAQLPQLQHFGIENSHGGFDWSIMREEWFLSIPKFSMRFGEVYRPIGFPEEEDRIMQYIFEFSNLPRSASKHVDLSQVCVSDGFLRTLVGVGFFLFSRGSFTLTVSLLEIVARSSARAVPVNRSRKYGYGFTQGRGHYYGFTDGC